MNISLPTKDQWKKIATAAAFSFASGFLAAFTAAGGIQSSWQATFSLIGGAAVSAANTTLYFLYVTFFKKAE